jgi:hypothetical protein
LEIGRVVGVLYDDVVIGCKQMQKDVNVVAIVVDVADVQRCCAGLCRVVVKNVTSAWSPVVAVVLIL